MKQPHLTAAVIRKAFVSEEFDLRIAESLRESLHDERAREDLVIAAAGIDSGEEREWEDYERAHEGAKRKICSAIAAQVTAFAGSVMGHFDLEHVREVLPPKKKKPRSPKKRRD